jgi:hypothetical protein
MERLNRFVATNPNGVAIVYAPAGYGKTTFLAHWIRQVEETGGWLSERWRNGRGKLLVTSSVQAVAFYQHVRRLMLTPICLPNWFSFPISPFAFVSCISEDDWRADLRNFLADSEIA